MQSKSLRSPAAPRLVDIRPEGVAVIEITKREVPASLVLDVYGAGFDVIRRVCVDAVLAGTLDPQIARGLIYASGEAGDAMDRIGAWSTC